MPEPGSDQNRPTPLLPPPWDGGDAPGPRIRDVRVILTAPEGTRLVRVTPKRTDVTAAVVVGAQARRTFGTTVVPLEQLVRYALIPDVRPGLPR